MLILVLWAMILNFHSPAKAGEDNKKARLLYENALEVYGEEDFSTVLDILDKVITVYPRMSYGKKAAYLTRIIIQYKLSLKELRELSGKNSLVQGILYQREGKEDKAFVEFQATLLDPALERWRFWAKEMIQSSRWNCNVWEKDHNLAIKMYEIMLEIGDNSAAQKLQIYKRLAPLYTRRRNYADAIKIYKEMIKTADSSGKKRIENKLIKVYKEAGMIKARAIEKENGLAITDKKLLGAYKKAAQSYEKKEDYKKAARMYRKALVLSPHNEDLKKLLKRVEKLVNKTGR